MASSPSPSPRLPHAHRPTNYSMWWLWLVLVVAAVLGSLSGPAAYVLPLPPSVQCSADGSGCSVDNYQGIWVDRKPCTASQAFFPTSEAELFDTVALASKTGSKVKVVGSSHSINKLVCPGGHRGLLISTQHLNSLIHVNLSSLTVTAHAGVLLRDLVDTVAQFGLTLPHTPMWQSVSVVGMISTGAHGSGLWGRGSFAHNYVVGMRLIVPAGEEEGYARVVELREGDEDLKAAKLSLGVLGAISQVTFQLEPMFKRSARLETREDTHLDGDRVLEFAREHEFGDIYWFPFSGKALFTVEDRVDVGTAGDGAYRNAILDKLDVNYIESLQHTLKAAEESQSTAHLCQAGIDLMNSRQSSGDGFVNYGTTFSGYPVVGFNHKMQTTGGCEKGDLLPVITPTGIHFNPSQKHDTDIEHDLLIEQDVYIPPQGKDDKPETCVWNPTIKGLFFFYTSIAVPVSRYTDAIADIKRLRDMRPEAFCSLAFMISIWMRFLPGSDAYLAGSTESIVFEFMYYRARDASTPRLHEDVFEEIEQILVDKVGGRPHWGKNRDWTFRNMQSRTVALGKFREVRQRFDPRGLFSSEWSDAILGIECAAREVQIHEEHCGLEGLCVCEEDSHCHPEKGYFCRPGVVYEEARVCRYETPQGSSDA